jgi:hypothetical protein
VPLPPRPQEEEDEDDIIEEHMEVPMKPRGKREQAGIHASLLAMLRPATCTGPF